MMFEEKDASDRDQGKSKEEENDENIDEFMLNVGTEERIDLCNTVIGQRFDVSLKDHCDEGADEGKLAHRPRRRPPFHKVKQAKQQEECDNGAWNRIDEERVTILHETHTVFVPLKGDCGTVSIFIVDRTEKAIDFIADVWVDSLEHISEEESFEIVEDVNIGQQNSAVLTVVSVVIIVKLKSVEVHEKPHEISKDDP